MVNKKGSNASVMSGLVSEV